MSTSLDLGVVTDPLLVFGGPYGNVQATRALLAQAERRGTPPAHMLCTGDVAAYCADPQATVDLIREAGATVVMGNCEESLGMSAEDCGCGFDKGSSCDMMAAQWYMYSMGALNEQAKAWMRTLPRRVTFTMNGRRLTAIHGGVTEINRFVFPATPAAEKAAEIEQTGGDGVIAGHSGLPFTDIIDGRLWHNSGVVGLPANDGTPRVWYSVLYPRRQGIVIEHHALDYDHAAAARAIRERGLPLPYADALDTGLWPSDEIMPPSDRGLRGNPLVPSSTHWG